VGPAISSHTFVLAHSVRLSFKQSWYCLPVDLYNGQKKSIILSKWTTVTFGDHLVASNTSSQQKTISYANRALIRNPLYYGVSVCVSLRPTKLAKELEKHSTSVFCPVPVWNPLRLLHIAAVGKYTAQKFWIAMQIVLKKTQAISCVSIFGHINPMDHTALERSVFVSGCWPKNYKKPIIFCHTKNLHLHWL
jgi:hypothetical protein